MIKGRIKTLQWVTVGLVAALLVISPWFIGGYFFRNTMTMIFINVSMALSLWIMILAGEPSFGQSGFAAVGGYCTAILTTNCGIEPWLSFPIAGFVGLIVSLLLGLLIAHLDGTFFMISTFAFMSLLYGLAMNLEVPFGGPLGIGKIPPPAGLETIFGNTDTGFYFLALTLMVITIFFIMAIAQSRLGLLFKAMEENRVLSSHCGVYVRKYKLQAMAVGCFFTALSGGIMASYLTQIAPPNFGFLQSLDIALFCYIGGIGSIAGPIVGAAVMVFLSQFLYSLGVYSVMVYGAVIALTVLLLRKGLISLPGIVVNSIRGRRIRKAT